MLELTTTRHNPLIDPTLHVWGWEIPVYLFLGGMVAGMMVFAGMAMLKTAKGEDTRNFFSLQTPLLAFVLLNLGMLALLLDLAHPLYVWAIYITFMPASPMAWGSWVLLIVYAILLVSALIRLPEAWPWIGRTLPVTQQGVGLVRDQPGPDARAGVDQHRVRRRRRRLHRHPAQHDGRAAAVEHVGAAGAVPRVRPVGRGRRAASGGARCSASAPRRRA